MFPDRGNYNVGEERWRLHEDREAAINYAKLGTPANSQAEFEECREPALNRQRHLTAFSVSQKVTRRCRCRKKGRETLGPTASIDRRKPLVKRENVRETRCEQEWSLHSSRVRRDTILHWECDVAET